MSVHHSRSILVGTLALAVLPAAARSQKVGFGVPDQRATRLPPREHGLRRQCGRRGRRRQLRRRLAAATTRTASSYGVFGQRYDSSGAAARARVPRQHLHDRATRRTRPWPWTPPATSSSSGTATHQDGSSYGVYGQRYDSSGAPLGAEFRVNTYTTERPAIPGRGLGRRPATSSSSGRATARTAAATASSASATPAPGARLGGEFRVNTYTDGQSARLRPWPRTPPATSSSSGRATARTAAATASSPSATTAPARRSGREFRVNTYTTSRQRYPSVATDAAGNFVVVWDSSRQDGSGYGVFGQRYDSSGHAARAPSSASTPTRRTTSTPRRRHGRPGNFVVVWRAARPRTAATRRLRPALRHRGQSRRRVPRQHLHHRAISCFPRWRPRASPVRRGLGVLGQDGSGGASSASASTSGGGGSTIHVGDLDRRAKNVGASWRAQVKTLVHDNGHGPVSGVLVTLDVSRGRHTDLHDHSRGQLRGERGGGGQRAQPDLHRDEPQQGRLRLRRRGEPRSRPRQQRDDDRRESALIWNAPLSSLDGEAVAVGSLSLLVPPPGTRDDGRDRALRRRVTLIFVGCADESA